MGLERTIKALRENKKDHEHFSGNMQRLSREKWASTRTSLKDLERRLIFPISQYIQAELNEHPEIYSKKEPFAVLDIGSGKNVGLRELKRIFGKRIFASGNALRPRLIRNLPPKFAFGIDRFYRTNFLDVPEDRKYDLIYSNMGPFHKHAELTGGIRKVALLLKKGGIAVLNVNYDHNPLTDEVVAYIERQYGVELSRQADVLTIRK